MPATLPALHHSRRRVICGCLDPDEVVGPLAGQLPADGIGALRIRDELVTTPDAALWLPNDHVQIRPPLR
jgi:hypothetical protein